jgi:hypothetical protein
VEPSELTWKADFEREGFAIVPEVLTPIEVSALTEALAAIPAGVTALDRGQGVYAMRNLLWAVPQVKTLAESKALRTLVQQVLGPGAFAVRGLLFDKTPEANWVVPWHQDLTIAVRRRIEAAGYGPWTVKGGVTHVRPPVAVLERMVTVRVHLDDCGATKGPLRVLPGSHAAGRLGAEETRAWLERVEPRACLVPQGGVLLMRPLLIHASATASAPERRRVIHLEYAAESLPGGVEWYQNDARSA